MKKKEDLKNRMRGGMDGLIRSTESVEKPTRASERVTVEKEVHCNFVMTADRHRGLKLIAAQRGVSLKEVLGEALDRYISLNV